MNFFKKFFSFILLVLLSISLASCDFIPNFDHNGDNGPSLENNWDGVEKEDSWLNEDPIPEKNITITLYVDDLLYDVIYTNNKSVINEPSLPTKNNYIPIGWEDSRGNIVSFEKPFSENTIIYSKYLADYVKIQNYASSHLMKASVNVGVMTYNKGFLGVGKVDREYSLGSGIIIHSTDKYYYLLTNQHVTDKGNKDGVDYTITDSYGFEYTGLTFKNIGHEEPLFDLAILAFEKGPNELRVLEREKSNSKRGTEVLVIGQPEGQVNTVTFGKITSYRKVKLTNGFEPSFDVMEHTAPTKGGSSGGAIIDFNYKLVALHFASNTSRGFGIPIEIVNEFLLRYNIS